MDLITIVTITLFHVSLSAYSGGLNCRISFWHLLNNMLNFAVTLSRLRTNPAVNYYNDGSSINSFNRKKYWEL
jgi:hypothetical protein